MGGGGGGSFSLGWENTMGNILSRHYSSMVPLLIKCTHSVVHHVVMMSVSVVQCTVKT